MRPHKKARRRGDVSARARAPRFRKTASRETVARVARAPVEHYDPQDGYLRPDGRRSAEPW